MSSRRDPDSIYLSITQVVVLAITGGVLPEGTKKNAIYGHWKFNNFVGKKVPNSESGGGDLVAAITAGSFRPWMMDTRAFGSGSISK